METIHFRKGKRRIGYMNKVKYGKVIFVCTGNSCRSPIAAGLLRKILVEKEIKGIEVDSAGIVDAGGGPPTEYAILVAAELGADISKHHSRVFDERDAAQNDIIITMEHYQSDYIKNRYPETEKRVFLLTELGSATEESDIPDPLGEDIGYYRYVASMILYHIKRAFPVIIEMTR